MSRPYKIAIYLYDFSGGGAERLQINLAQYFLDHGLSVEFVVDRAEGPLLAAVPAGAKITSLRSKRTLHSLPRLARYLRTQKPDLLLSNLSHNNIIALWARKLALGRTKIVVCQHSILLDDSRRQGGKYRLVPLLYRLFLPWADAVIAVSQGMANDMAALTKLPKNRIAVIHNGVVTPDFDAKASMPLTHRWLDGKDSVPPVFVAVGRLVELKDFSTLLHAFARVVAKRPARLIILGEGPERAALTALAAKLGISDKVDLAGFQTNPLPYMRLASAVVLSSQCEGFAIALAEAMACGTKVVSTDCPYGPAEILDHGAYGILTPVGDAAALAQGMLKTLDAPVDKERLKERGREFSMDICGGRYMDLFARL
jgi:glycosyltransferase involved in cell wall biosynthesis